eukprot:UN08821
MPSEFPKDPHQIASNMVGEHFPLAMLKLSLRSPIASSALTAFGLEGPALAKTHSC